MSGIERSHVLVESCWLGDYRPACQLASPMLLVIRQRALDLRTALTLRRRSECRVSSLHLGKGAHVATCESRLSDSIASPVKAGRYPVHTAGYAVVSRLCTLVLLRAARANRVTDVTYRLWISL